MRSRRTYPFVFRSSALAAVVALVAAFAAPALAVSPNVVISQVYGAGGNSGATYNQDFVELFNRSASPVSLAGWSIQYTSSTGTGLFGSATNLITPLSGSIAAGQYILVGESSGANGIALPAPIDITDATPISMAAGAGKIALVNTTTPLGCNGSSTPCSAGALATIVDLVGYGTGTNFFEGSGPTGTTSTVNAAFRNAFGCTDTDNNAGDFTVAAVAPRNSVSTTVNCAGGSTNPSGVGAASPSNGLPNDSTLLTVTVTNGTGPTSTGVTVTGNLTAIGGSSTQQLFDDNTNGDVTAGDNIFSFNATVANATTPGLKSLPFSILDAQARTGSGSISYTVNNPPPVLVPIHSIQGSTSTSPYNGNIVSTSGIVTGKKVFGGRGFFIQDPSPDADPATSEGIFVFTSTAPAVSIGDSVQVTGTVQEFRSSTDLIALTTTEIALSPSISILSTGNALPFPVTLQSSDLNPAGAADQLERYEGMRVHVDDLVVVAPTQGFVDEANATSASSGVFYGVLPGYSRPFREAGVEVTTSPFPGSPCCFPIFDTNPERIRVDSQNQTGTVAVDVATGAVVSNLTGPLDYGQDTYTVLMEAATVPTVNRSAEMTVVNAPAPLANELTIASANLERFFDTANDPSTSDPVLSATAFANRLKKASLLVRNVLRTPDVVAIVEVENLTTLQSLAAQINNDAVAAANPDPGYSAYLMEGNDIGGIDVGFLVKGSVTVVDVVQYGLSATYLNPNTNTQELLNDRPPLVLRAIFSGPNASTFPATIIVNHLRSLSGINDPVDGPRIRAKRQAQAEYLANLIQGFQTADATARIVSVGDYNAFEISDGWVDSLGTIKGDPTGATMVVNPSPDLVNPNLTNLTDSTPAADRYSYSFSGNAQEIDHILVNGVVLPYLSRVGHPRVDADFPEINRNDVTSPSRISDHDPVISYYKFPVTVTTGAGVTPTSQQYSDTVTFSATASPATDGVDPTATTVDFYVGTQLMGSAPLTPDGFGGLTGTLSNVALLETVAGEMAAGPHTVKAVFSGGGAGITVPDATTSLTITREDAVVTPSASNAAWLAAVGASSGAFTLDASITNAADGSLGDACLAAPVDVTLTPIFSGASYTTTATQSSCNGVTRVVSAAFNLVAQNVYLVSYSVGGNYYQGSAQSLLTVVRAGEAKLASGGGRLLHGAIPSEFGFYARTAASGFTMQWAYLEHRAAGDYLIKGNVPTTALTITNGSPKKAAFGGNVAYPPSEAADRFSVNASDNGGSGDKYGMRVTLPPTFTTPVPALSFEGIPLTAGNILINP